jgi:hypothetical protein
MTDRRVNSENIQEMDLVWLFTPRLDMAETKKTANMWGLFPWVVTKIIDERNAIIQSDRGESTRVHMNRLRKYLSPLRQSLHQAQDNTPVIIHHILKPASFGLSKGYMVRWFPFNKKEDSFVKMADIPTRAIREWQYRQDNKTDDDLACEICAHTTDAADMLICDGCDKGFHTFCTGRTKGDIPQGDWFCTTCTPFAAQAPSVV